MGGGVSLGSFSGAALTEALKLLVLFGKDKSGKDYDEVIVDGMSGASAGAIALTIMLKCLMDYKAMIPIYNSEKRDDEEMLTEELLEKELEKAYFSGVSGTVPSEKAESLKALQLAQKVQHQLWTQLVTTEELFRTSSLQNPHKSFGLLNRNILTRLANKYIVDSGNLELENRQVLDAKRIIFACSLTNVLPMVLNGNNPAVDGNSLQENFLKSTGSENHTELRVVDFVFDPAIKNSSDNRWFEFCRDPENQKTKKATKNGNMILGIKDKKAWAILSASALACGAFPVAFDPVLLKRYRDEYNVGDWPRVFDRLAEEIEKNQPLKKSFFSEDDNNYVDYKSFNFPYIDGGTFNNEPIREAFRIGSFQDFGKEDENSDRLVLFVDPIVRKGKYNSFNVKSFGAINAKENEIVFKSESSKMLNNITDILGVLANQGSIKEDHRIRDAKESFKLRNALFSYIGVQDSNDNGEPSNFHRTMTNELLKTTFDKIGINISQDPISVGTRDMMTYFKNEFNKNCRDNGKNCRLTPKSVYDQIEVELNKAKPERDKIFELFNTGITDDDERTERKNLFAQTVFRVMIDFSLATAGKNSKAELMAILPIEVKNFQTIHLPGSEVEAFGGFASVESREYAFGYARLSTLSSLMKKDNGYRDPGMDAIISDPTLSGIHEDIVRDISQMRFYDPEYKYSRDIQEKLYYPMIDRALDILPISATLKKAITKIPFFLASTVGGFVLLFKDGIKKLRSIRSNLYLKADKISDEINYKELIPITISVLSEKKLPKTAKVKTKVAHGKEIKIKMEEYEIPANRGYQYLFKLYYLEYVDPNRAIEKTESVSMHKFPDSDLISQLGLSARDKIRNPSIDGNINMAQYRHKIEEESRKIEIKDIAIGDIQLGDIISDINNRSFSLYYSLKNLNYHVNPILEYNLDKKNDTWYFKENTKAYFFNLL